MFYLFREMCVSSCACDCVVLVVLSLSISSFSSSSSLAPLRLPPQILVGTLSMLLVRSSVRPVSLKFFGHPLVRRIGHPLRGHYRSEGKEEQERETRRERMGAKREYHTKRCVLIAIISFVYVCCNLSPDHCYDRYLNSQCAYVSSRVDTVHDGC